MSLIKRGLIEWDGMHDTKRPMNAWELARGSFRLTEEGRNQRYGALEREHFGDPDKQTGIYTPQES